MQGLYDATDSISTMVDSIQKPLSRIGAQNYQSIQARQLTTNRLYRRVGRAEVYS
jgi:hypothetical protein